MNKKFGKGAVKTADEVKVTDDMLFERDKRRALRRVKRL